MKPGEAATLADVKGKTIGVKGKIPASVAAMLAGAGLDRGHRLPDRAARRVRPDRPLPPRGHRRLPRLQEQRAGPARPGRAEVRPLRPDEVRRPRVVRGPVRHQGVGRRPPDGDRGLPAGDDEGARRRPRRSGRRDADGARPRPGPRQPELPVAGGRDVPLGHRRQGAADARRRPAPASASPTSPPCRPSSTPTPRSACSAAPPRTPPRSSTPPPSSRSTTAPTVIWPSG